MHIELSTNPLMTLVGKDVSTNNVSEEEISFENVLANIKKIENGLFSVIETNGENEKIAELCQTTINLLDKINLNNEKENSIDEDEINDIIYDFLSHMPKEQVVEFEKIVSDITTKITAIEGEFYQKNSIDILDKNMVVKQAVQNENFPVEVEMKINETEILINGDVALKEVMSEESISTSSFMDNVESNIDSNVELNKEISIKAEFVGKLEELISKVPEKSETQVLKMKPLLDQLNKIEKSNKGYGETNEKYSKSNVFEKISNNGEDFSTLVENKSVSISIGNDLKIENVAFDSQTTVIEQVIEKIDVIQMKDGNSVDVKLKPDSLGSVSIKVETIADNIKVEIITDNKDVHEVLVKEMSEITAVLADKGVKPELIKVTLNESDNNSYNHNQHFDNKQNNFSGQKDGNKYFYQRNRDFATVEQDEKSEAKMIASNSKFINIYV